MKFFEKTRDVLGRRPWLPAAVYFVLYGLVDLTYFVALANLIPARYRLWEELDKSELAVVAKVGTAVLRIWRAKDTVRIVALVVPIIPLCMKRYNTAFLMFVFGVAIGIGESALANFMFYHDCDCLVGRDDAPDTCRRRVRCNVQEAEGEGWLVRHLCARHLCQVVEGQEDRKEVKP